VLIVALIAAFHVEISPSDSEDARLQNGTGSGNDMEIFL
jgi:hypothetical protein